MKKLLLVCSFFLAVIPVHAVIVAGNQTGHDSDLGGVWGWNYTGTVLFSGGSVNASGVYLGNYGGTHWVLTANHVATAGLGSFSLGDYSYSFNQAQGERVTDPDTHAFVDLYLVPITSGSAAALSYLDTLTNLTISSDTPINTPVTMVGSGRNRAANASTWYVDTDTDPYTWSSTSSPDSDITMSGYEWAGGNTKRWADNEIMSIETDGAMIYLATDFDPIQGEGQAAIGDSGGGIFSGSTTLSGIMLAVGGFSGQPSETSVYGNVTYSADLSQYKSSILGVIVPEPGAFTLLALGAALLLWATRRGRAGERPYRHARVESRLSRRPAR